MYHTKPSQTYSLLNNEQMMIWFESCKRRNEMNEMILLVSYDKRYVSYTKPSQTYLLLITKQMMIWFEICKRRNELNWNDIVLVSYGMTRDVNIAKRDRLTPCWITSRLWYDLRSQKINELWIELILLVSHDKDMYHTKQSQTYTLLINKQMMIWFESCKRWNELNWNEIVSVIW